MVSTSSNPSARSLVRCADAVTRQHLVASVAVVQSPSLGLTSLLTAGSTTAAAGHVQAASARSLEWGTTGMPPSPLTTVPNLRRGSDSRAGAWTAPPAAANAMRASLVCCARGVKVTFQNCFTLFLILTSRSEPLIGSYITVGGSKMHSSCFTCSECSRPISDTSGTAISYYEKQGNFYCRNDYIRLFMPVCAVQTHV
jgi:hypothetical protein